MAIPDWSPKFPNWLKDEYKVLLNDVLEVPEKQTVEKIMSNSAKFPIKFPVSTGQCKTLQTHVSEESLERNINSVYPVIHESALKLYCDFILYKRKKGSNVEKSLYKDLSLKGLIDRLLKKRAVMFMGKDDKYLLLDGTKGAGKWDTIGTDKETPPLVLEHCISYDEVKLSVFLSVSSYTYFVNAGDRKNKAKLTTINRKNIAEEGIIVGMIGPRLKKVGVMEYQEIVASKTQNTKQNGYGKNVDSLHKLFSDYYEEDCLDYPAVLTAKRNAELRYVQLNLNAVFDNHIYHKRLTISIDTLLLEANHRAKLADTTAFIHVVGLGLGVWRASSHQDQVYMDSFAQRIRTIGSKLPFVSDICFAWINVEKCGETRNGELFPVDGHPLNGIKIHINKRNPHEKIIDGKLLVVSYAWDGNALPGNEYWSGKLGSSGDSAAASSTQIAEIHNVHINPLVCADNLRIIKSDGVIVSFEEYLQVFRCESSKRKK